MSDGGGCHVENADACVGSGGSIDVGRLLIAAGQSEAARGRLDTALALAEDTGMHFYDAELLRLRAQTRADPDARASDIAAAFELARHQGATLFELRAAIDRLAAVPADPGFLPHELPLLKMRALLAQAVGDENASREFMDQYRVMATAAGFEGFAAPR